MPKIHTGYNDQGDPTYRHYDTDDITSALNEFGTKIKQSYLSERAEDIAPSKTAKLGN